MSLNRAISLQRKIGRVIKFNFQDLPALLVNLDAQAPRALMDHQDHQDLKVLQDNQVPMACLVNRDATPLAHLPFPEIPDQQAQM